MAQVPPVAKKINKKLIKHGHERIDPYFWMNERDSADVLDYIEAENSFAKAYFEPILPLQNSLLEEFENRIDPNDQSAPFFIQGKQYQYQNIAGKDYQQIIHVVAGEPNIYFDENQRAEGKTYYDLGDWSPSPDNSMLAFSEDHIGRRKYTIFFRSENTQEILTETIEDTDGSIVWANVNRTVFYVKKDPKTLREFQVYRHEIGNPFQKDVLVYEETDERFSVFISKTITQKYICIHIQSSSTSEIRLVDADEPKTEPILFLSRKSGVLYEIEHHSFGFYVLTNDAAPNKKIIFYSNFPSNDPVCKEVVEHLSDQLIENMLVLENNIIVQKRIQGLQQIENHQINNNKIHLIQFQEENYSAGIGFNDNFYAKSVYLTYNSMSTPASVYVYDLTKNEKTIFFQKKLIDTSFNPSNYETYRVWATANDGTKIPISILYKKGIELSKAPLLLYGYGSYGITIPTNFSALRLSLVNRGFVYAIAHIRGGKYLGESWYENGKFTKKRNTFTDFINSAEYLSNQKYCDPSKMYAQGGSAGGLLMGAVANLAPYLWKGIIAQVPFVDVLTTMLDENIPLTVGEYEEWGNPSEEDYYWYMLNYSPYDNVRKMNYPAMYITTGYHDSQVQYWEPLKWVSKLRDYKTNQTPLVFECNMDAGHGGGSGRTSERLEVAKEYAFILNLEGIEK
jgi:oligopeptidase B